MEFVDRVSAYPNRYAMTDENGRVSYVVLERADEPIVPGTPMNAETFSRMYEGAESEEYPGCYYHTVGDETEWINPPMMLDVEYRTTERFNGFPVYVKRISFADADTGNDSAQKAIFKHGCTLVSYSVVRREKGAYQSTLPIFNGNGTLFACAMINTLLGDMAPETYPDDYAWIITPGMALSDYSDFEMTAKYIKG